VNFQRSRDGQIEKSIPTTQRKPGDIIPDCCRNGVGMAPCGVGSLIVRSDRTSRTHEAEAYYQPQP